MNTVGTGYGEPVDDIDRSCRSMSRCYECAKIDFGKECNTELLNYRWHGFLDTDGHKTIQCDDEAGSCERTICDCDKRLAEDLRENERVWDLHNHQKWGEFNREFKCFQTEERFSDVLNKNKQAQEEMRAAAAARGEDIDSMDWGNSARAFPGMGDISEFGQPSLVLKLAGEFGDPNKKTCCGEYPRRFPISTLTKKGDMNKQQCCGKKSYNVNTQCCDHDKTVHKMGSCVDSYQHY
jgi:hypothetical protein